MLEAEKNQILLEIHHKETFEDLKSYIYVYFQANQKTANSESNGAEQVHKHPQWELAENEKAINEQAKRCNILVSSRSTKQSIWGHQNLLLCSLCAPTKKTSDKGKTTDKLMDEHTPVEPSYSQQAWNVLITAFSRSTILRISRPQKIYCCDI